MKSRIIELLTLLATKGLIIISTQDSDGYWHLILNGQYKGFWTEIAMVSVLNQLLKPTYPSKWFTSQGLPVPVPTK